MTADEANERIDTYFAAKKKVHEMFAYNPGWREIPMDDAREMYWMLVGGEGYGAKCVYSDEPLTEMSIAEGHKIYSGTVYTQRHLPTWVYRTQAHALVCVDTHTDGNKLLMIFSVDRECTDESMRKAYSKEWGSVP